MIISVESATDLSPDQKKTLEKKLSPLDKGSVQYDYHTDPSLIAGLRISAGNKVIDLSVKARLNQLQSQISK